MKNLSDVISQCSIEITGYALEGIRKVIKITASEKGVDLPPRQYTFKSLFHKQIFV